jgi:hypothetical protein
MMLEAHAVFIAEMPPTAAGKIHKLLLRQRFKATACPERRRPP